MKKILLLFLMAVSMLAVLSSCNVRKIARRIYNTHIARAPYDVVVVPGMPYDSLNQIKTGFNARIVWAKKLYDCGIVKNVIFSGAACYTPYIEAEIMKQTAIAMGMPAEHIYTENKAEHTKENVYYGWLLAKRLGFEKVAFASDPYQSFFVEGFIQANTPEMGILPIDVDSLKKYYIPLPSIDASAAYVKDFLPLNKRESFGTRVRHTNHNTLPEIIPQEYLK